MMGQVLAQPVFRKIESLTIDKWPNSKFVKAEYPIRIGSKTVVSLNPLRLTGRTIFVVLVTLVAMAMPFFNDVIALLGALGFWPLAVYFPVQMHIAQNKIKRGSSKWLKLQLLNFLCLLVSLAAAAASIQGIGEALRSSKLFEFKE